MSFSIQRETKEVEEQVKNAVKYFRLFSFLEFFFKSPKENKTKARKQGEKSGAKVWAPAKFK